MTDFRIENFTTARAATGYVAWFDCRLADAGVCLCGLSLKRPALAPNELWLVMPVMADHTYGRRAYYLDGNIRRAIGEAAAAKYRATTGVDAFYVPPRRAADELSNDAAGVRRVPGAVEETMQVAGL